MMMQQQQQQNNEDNVENTITPFCYPKANLIHKQAILHERIGLKNIKNLDTLYTVFFKSYKCWDTVPHSSKLIVLDTELRIEKAFFALRYNGLRAAPLWDSAKHQFVGMLTITDFINLLIMRFEQYQSSGTEELASSEDDIPNGDHDDRESSPVLKAMDNESIDTWCRLLQKRKHPFIGLDPDESLFVALERLLRHKVHRLPLVDRATGDPLYILTHKRLLRFLFLYIYDLPTPKFMHQSLAEANIGTYAYLAAVTKETKLLDALKLFIRRRVSALPVLNEAGELLDIYSKFDVIHLAAQKKCDPEMTMEEALAKRPSVFGAVITCKKTESVAVVTERIARHEVHRLVVTDEDNKVVGVVSLSDLLKFLILRPETGVRRGRKSDAIPEDE